MTPTRVLVVDDEVPIIDLVRGYLEAEGMDVIAAADGPSAVDVIRQRVLTEIDVAATLSGACWTPSCCWPGAPRRSGIPQRRLIRL